ncbi:MAG: NAD(P)/FAD-dependent oxidoreductase [Thermoplasmata archaeon]
MAAAQRVDLLVLGAGIAGTATAYHLARRRAGSVLLFDPRTPAAGATGRAAGIITDQLWDRWDVEVTRAAQAEYREILGRRDPAAYTVNGFVRWTADPSAETVVDAAYERLRSWGVQVDRIDGAELARSFPWGRFEDVRVGLRGRADAVVTPSTLAESYLFEARAIGIETAFGETGARLGRSGDGVELYLSDRTVRPRTTIVAAGAWSKRILQELGAPLPLVPYRVQAATLRPSPTPPEAFPSGHDIDSDVYFRPEGAGRVLAGDGTERAEADPERFVPSGDPAFLEHLARTFAARLPGWADAELTRAWAGVCTSTPDRRPLIGAIDAARGLYTIVGFNGFGVMRGGGAARWLVDRIVDGPNGAAADRLASVDPRRFRPPFPEFLPQPGFTLEGGDAPRF